MSDLRPVEVTTVDADKSQSEQGRITIARRVHNHNGLFHRWIVKNGEIHELVELEDGRLALFEYSEIRFTDRDCQGKESGLTKSG